MRTVKVLLAAMVLLQCVCAGLWYHGLYIWSCEPLDYGDSVEVAVSKGNEI